MDDQTLTALFIMLVTGAVVLLAGFGVYGMVAPEKEEPWPQVLIKAEKYGGHYSSSLILTVNCSDGKDRQYCDYGCEWRLYPEALPVSYELSKRLDTLRTAHKFSEHAKSKEK